MSCSLTEYTFMRMHNLAEDYNFKWSFNPFDGYYTIRSEEVLPEDIQAKIRQMTNGRCKIEVYI